MPTPTHGDVPASSATGSGLGVGESDGMGVADAVGPVGVGLASGVLVGVLAVGEGVAATGVDVNVTVPEIGCPSLLTTR